MQRFPDVRTLADAPDGRSAAPVDRPRLLRARAQSASRRAAHARPARRRISANRSMRSMELPGIGRSTAGAILAISAGARHSILDGNVKRVLARYYAIDGAPDEAATLAQLWKLADDNTPANGRCHLYAGHHGSRRDGVHGSQAALRGMPDRRRLPRAHRGPPGRAARGETQARGTQDENRGDAGGAPRLRSVAGAAPAERHLGRAVVPAGVRAIAMRRKLSRRTSSRVRRLAHAPLPDIEHSFTHFDLVITPDRGALPRRVAGA